ncbi:hypothetical protein [Rhodococcoides fascians]|uniref:hypothetical protein n=1 Tax=Rhodococcoides fascians TaxID=1828 RepID=UPI000AB3C43B|nr:hypothetical protein [Rhodococcus fascians]
MVQLNDEQLVEIQYYLDQGLDPVDVANTLARLADIEDLGDIAMIQSAAVALSRGETP